MALTLERTRHSNLFREFMERRLKPAPVKTVPDLKPGPKKPKPKPKKRKKQSSSTPGAKRRQPTKTEIKKRIKTALERTQVRHEIRDGRGIMVELRPHQWVTAQNWLKYHCPREMYADV